MNSQILDASRQETITRAATLLQQGQLVILPSETVYGLAVNLKFEDARNRAKTLKHIAGNPGWVIHVAGPQDALNYAPQASALARRVLSKGWPGPIAVQLPVDPAQISALEAILGPVAAETIVDGHITLRCPDNYATREILAAVGAPVALLGVGTAGAPAREISAVPPAIAAQVAALVDAGLTKYNKTSTVVRISGDQLTVVRPGLIDVRTLSRLADRVLLFVCSGNTCRSPMAAALARRLLADKFGVRPEDLGSRHIVVESAGLHAMSGRRATPEAQDAVRELQADLRSHLSQAVTGDLLRRADVIYTMTSAQRDDILAAMPALGPKTHRLDPDADIEDPIGGDIDTYRQVAHHLAELLNQRLAELTL